MANPLVITVSHQLTREEAQRRLRDNTDWMHAQLAPYTSAVDSRWTDDRMDFRVAAMGQTVTGQLEVLDEAVRIEVQLPRMLAWLGRLIGDRVRQRGQLLLNKR